MEKSQEHILWFDQLGIEDVPLVGGKNASLGEMYQHLVPKGVRIPNGFAVTAQAYFYILDKAGLRQQLQNLFNNFDVHDLHQLQDVGQKARDLILHAHIPEDLQQKMIAAYSNLCKEYGENTDVAVRSSATAEDLPDASFAGQQETYLNIRGPQMLIEACKKCFASLFTNRAISYRQEKGFDHFAVGLSIGVQKMVRSDKATSGVMFSIDTETGFKEAAFITAAYGLGENVVQGAVNPDEYYVFKPKLKEGFKSIISKQIGSKEMRMIYDQGGNKSVKNIPVPKEEQEQFAMTDNEILELASWAVTIEEHYSEKRGKYTPMDMEWAKDGITNQLFIVQARPETVHSQKDMNVMHKFKLTGKGETIIKGNSVGEKIGAGPANVIKSVEGIHQFRKGDVLVTEMTDPDWEPIMKIASAIVTNRGGRTCHAAIISRELGIPCVVGTGRSTEVIKTGDEITVDCSQGKEGFVYKGKVPFETEDIVLDKIPDTKTKIMMNLGNPDQAFEFSFLPNKGVGLAREEFVINEYIKVHPLALLAYPNLKDQKAKQKIEEVTAAYQDKPQFFVDKLAEGIGKIAAAFYPKPVIVRLSDFKSNEYRNLIGGDEFEPTEDNPMIGWRGASRYYDEKYKAGFELECRAFKKAREEFGLNNIKIMIPFPRTVKEVENVLKVMGEQGLKRGDNGLEIYGMCEIPSNVILADQFLDHLDGFSIGSNDLTQLTLGLDRDSELVSHIYDERNEAVKRLIKWVIETCNHRGKYVGICGQAPSDFEDFAEFVVEAGIQTMSLNPDTVIKTTLKIAEKEKALGK